MSKLSLTLYTVSVTGSVAGLFLTVAWLLLYLTLCWVWIPLLFLLLLLLSTMLKSIPILL